MAAPQYDYRHQQIRKALIASGYWLMAPCPRCAEPMKPGQRLDLDHTDDRAGYLGLSHSSCNQAAGSRVGSARRKARIAKTRTPAEQQAHDARIAKQMRREAKRAWAALDQPGRDW